MSSWQKFQIPPNPQSQEAFDLARRWLGSCVETHNCGPNKEVPLPSRILDVGGKGLDQIHLYIAADGEIQTGKYVALSYCWGESLPFTTTCATISQRRKGIPLLALPRTVRDAVIITRQLECQYLWVDSLCILQGSDDEAKYDWNMESSRMQSVFSNAFVTIVAAASSNCNGGIFYPRSSSLLFCGKNGNGGLFEGIYNVFISSEVRSISDEPIHGRAWALQEWELSPRLLTYNLSQMSWLCNNERINERSDWGNDGHGVYKRRLLARYPITNIPDWTLVVTNYCGRNLTNSTDKLPALAGLAERYHNLTGDCYLAGLWKSQLLPSLLWIRDDIHKIFLANATERTLLDYRAPSWSWASRDGNIVFILSRATKISSCCAKIIECSVENENFSPFGCVKGGKLVIRGPLRRVCIRVPRDNSYESIFTCSQEENIQSKLATSWLDRGDAFALNEATSLEGVYCLLIAVEVYYGLVLQKIPQSDNKFVRLGVFCTVDFSTELWFGTRSSDVVEQTIIIL